MSESGELPEAPTYQEIREELAETNEPQVAKETSLQADHVEDRAEKNPGPPKRKWKQRPRKDVKCEKCGKAFSSNTRHHLCVEGSVPLTRGKENIRPEPRAEVRGPPPRAPLTYDDVRSFLTEERSRYRAAAQRDAWIGALF